MSYLSGYGAIPPIISTGTKRISLALGGRERTRRSRIVLAPAPEAERLERGVGGAPIRTVPAGPGNRGCPGRFDARGRVKKGGPVTHSLPGRACDQGQCAFTSVGNSKVGLMPRRPEPVKHLAYMVTSIRLATGVGVQREGERGATEGRGFLRLVLRLSAISHRDRTFSVAARRPDAATGSHTRLVRD